MSTRGDDWDGSLDDDLGRDPHRERAGDDYNSDDSDRYGYTRTIDDYTGNLDDDLGREPGNMRAGDDFSKEQAEYLGYMDPTRGFSPDDDVGRSKFWNPRSDIDKQGNKVGGWSGRISSILKPMAMSALMGFAAPPVLGAIYNSGPLGKAAVRVGMGGMQAKDTLDNIAGKFDVVGKLMGQDPGQGFRMYEGGPRQPTDPTGRGSRAGGMDRTGSMAQNPGAAMPGTGGNLQAMLAQLQAQPQQMVQPNQQLLQILARQPQRRRSTLFM